MNTEAPRYRNIEDIIEEIVGDINDEFDDDDNLLKAR